LLVVAVAVAVYLNGIPGQFVFDDKLIQRDPRISGQTSFWTIFVTDYWHAYIGTSHDLYRPLTIASYALNRMLTGLHPEAFHAVNIVLHAAASVLVVLLVEALLADGVLALAAGLLFAAHPVHTEAVTGIVGRAEVLSALFLLLALWVQARDYGVLGRGPRVGLPLALLAYFCALGAKETAIVGPGLVALVDRVQQQRRAPERWDWRRTAVRTALYVGVAATYVVIRYAVIGRFLQAPPPKSDVLFGKPLAMRVVTACEIFAIYGRLLVLPRTLSADYSYRQVPLLDTLDTVAAMGLLAAVAVAGVGLWALRRRVWPVWFAIGFFLVA